MLALLALVGVCFHPTEHAYRYRIIPFLPSQWELVGVCWCSVNIKVIFHKILNPTANLFVGVCWHFVCAVWIGLYIIRTFRECRTQNVFSQILISLQEHSINVILRTFCPIIYPTFIKRFENVPLAGLVKCSKLLALQTSVFTGLHITKISDNKYQFAISSRSFYTSKIIGSKWHQKPRKFKLQMPAPTLTLKIRWTGREENGGKNKSGGSEWVFSEWWTLPQARPAYLRSHQRSWPH